jgi:hypothetical protein
VRAFQERPNWPAWRSHLNRAVTELIENAGFRIERLDNGYMRGPKPMTFMYEGSARPPLKSCVSKGFGTRMCSALYL